MNFLLPLPMLLPLPFAIFCLLSSLGVVVALVVVVVGVVLQLCCLGMDEDQRRVVIFHGFHFNQNANIFLFDLSFLFYTKYAFT